MILLVDNYDSFTWNLVQLLGELGAEMTVRRNDQITVAGVRALQPQAVVISPGPCTPKEAGVSVPLIRDIGEATPVLGVCLGHQAIAEAFGGTVVRAARPVHGKVTTLRHTGAGPFAGVPQSVTVARYHSLTVDVASLPAELEPIAWSEDPVDGAEIQALTHRSRPTWGVQFHPESIASEHGRDMLRNFLELI